MMSLPPYTRPAPASGGSGSSAPPIVQEAFNAIAPGSNVTATFPRASTAGNTLVAVVGCDIRDGIATPGGWTLLGSAVSSLYAGIYVYIKTSVGDNGFSAVPGGSVGTARTIYLCEITGAYTLDEIATSETNANVTTYVHPSITPTTDALVFSFAVWVIAQFENLGITSAGWSPVGTIPTFTNTTYLAVVGGIARTNGGGNLISGPMSSAGITAAFGSVAAITFSLLG